MAKGLMIDYQFCTGCRTCEVACRTAINLGHGQFGIKVLEDGPRQFANSKKWELNYIPYPTSLCDLCAARIEEGKDPSCVHHCPTKCMSYGEVDDLAKEIADKPNRVLFVPVVQ